MDTERLSIKLQRDDNEIMTTWEVQDFLTKLTTNYYKLDIVNEISKEINSGAKLENIIILDKSFDFKISYNYLKETDIIKLTDINGGKDFFHLGIPIGYFPSKDILNINIKFSIIRRINTFLNKRIKRMLDKNNINYIIESSLEEAISFIVDSSEKIINENVEKDEIRKKYLKEIRDISKVEYNKINNYIEDRMDIDNIKGIIKGDKTKELEEHYEIVYNKYFLEFKNKLIDCDRPVIGVLSENNKEVKILCKSYIYKDTQNPRFLDLREFSHNSPTIVKICIGAIFAIPSIPLIYSIKNNLKISKESCDLDKRERNFDYELDEMQREGCILDINKQSQQQYHLDNLKEDLEMLCDEYDLKNYTKINNKFLRKGIEEINSEVINRINDNIIYYNFNNDNIDIKRDNEDKN